MPIKQLKGFGRKTDAAGFTTHRLRSSNNGAAPADTGRPSRPQEFRSSKPKRNKRSVLGVLLRLAIFLFLAGGIFLVSIFAWYSKDLPDPNRIIERDVAQSTKIYDRTGEQLLYEIHGTERRTVIELSSIPQYAIDATIAVEDKNFFKHKGLSLHNILKAMALEVLNKIGLYNKTVPGGSTLTQQFIKNAVLTTEKSYTRKIKEFVLAYRLEQRFTKEEILKLYFNEIPYGSTAYGIEAASHIYFGQSAKDLTLAEAAVLAALPQAPSYYSPYGSHKDELLSRQRYILGLMVEQGYINEEQAAQAKEETLEFKKRQEDILAPHFVFMVKEELSQRYGERLVEQGGLKIITTLDWGKQQKAQAVVEEIAKTNLEKYQANNASLVTIDVASGEILALIGSKNYFDDSIDGQVNVATSPRQPGSSLKPVVYVEALSRGYRPDTMLFDLRTQFASSGEPYSPQDYDGKERGPVTLKQALQGSLNIPAVKMLYLVGVPEVVDLADKLGYTTLTSPDRYGLSLVLGGGEVKLVEHANAYAALAREGIFKPSVSVLKVEGPDGKVIEEHRDDPGKRVLDREPVRQLNNILSDNEARSYIFGAVNHLTLADRPVAAKTGTTNNYHDAWTIGFTPDVVTGVWVGNNDNTAMSKGADGSVVAAPIWQKYMGQILSGIPAKDFPAPKNLDACDRSMLCGSLGGEIKVKINKDTGNLAGPYTPPSKIEEKTYRQVHSILQYVNKADPTGPPPTDPAQDPQYLLWEKPIQAWATKEGWDTSTIPTKTDDLYRPEDQPEISWLAPDNNETITGSPYTFEVSARARRGIKKVDYWLQDTYLGTSSQAPFSLLFTPSVLTPNGSHELRAVAYDDIGNEQSARVNVTLKISDNDRSFGVAWVSPTANGAYRLDSVPSMLQLRINNPEQIKKIDFYYLQDGASRYIGFQNVSGQSEITQSWSPPSKPGDYKLYLVITNALNQVLTWPPISITLTGN